MTELSKAGADYCRAKGRAYAWGVVDVLAIIIIVGFVLQGAWNLVLNHDDCDKDFWHHCGASVVTDAKTGVQYLVTPDGGIIERKERK